jgi:hypothetical protein
MQMADRHGQRIRRVVRRWCRTQTKQQLHHLTDLLFLGPAVADNRAFDLSRRVLDDVATRFDRGEHRDTAGVTELERTADVRRMKQVFNRNTVRAIGRQQRRKLGVDSRETIGKCVARTRSDGATGQEHVPASIRLHATVAGALGAGIDAENSHAREASISFSSMSKFAQTC